MKRSAVAGPASVRDGVSRSRIVALDGLRGLAALAVLVFHMTDQTWPAHGYLAVDLFFLLSGFVLAGAFEERLRAGMSWLAFMRERMARLYPLYAAGLTIGMLGALATVAPAQVLPAWALDLSLVGANGFSLDPPLWSLVLEIGIGAIFAAGLYRLGNRSLAVLVLTAGAVLTIAGLRLGPQGGLPPNFGWARVLFSFPLGWLAWRLRDRLAPQVGVRAPALAVIGVCASWAAPQGVLTDLASVLLLYPLAIVALALSPQPSGLLSDLCSRSGALSYPLYASHAVAIPIALSMLPVGDPTLRFLVGVSVALAVAWALHKTVEPMGRRMLSPKTPAIVRAPA